jgi:hypothetical protein
LDETVGLDFDRPDMCERCVCSAHVRQEAETMRQSPCKGCLKRSAHPNCHITCDLYAEFVHFRQTYNADRRKKNLIYEYIKKKQEQRR